MTSCPEGMRSVSDALEVSDSHSDGEKFYASIRNSLNLTQVRKRWKEQVRNSSLGNRDHPGDTGPRTSKAGTEGTALSQPGPLIC